jgi:hypothetical protein
MISRMEKGLGCLNMSRVLEQLAWQAFLLSVRAYIQGKSFCAQFCLGVM